MQVRISPDSSSSFDEIRKQARHIESQIRQIDKLRENRVRLFDNCMDQYSRYVKKENELIDRNSKHCEPRNQWFREEMNKAWSIAVANRGIVLRSVARTNVLKKDVDDWLGRIEQQSLRGNNHESFVSHEAESHAGESQLIDKYNQILLEYGHKI